MTHQDEKEARSHPPAHTQTCARTPTNTHEPYSSGPANDEGLNSVFTLSARYRLTPTYETHTHTNTYTHIQPVDGCRSGDRLAQ